MAPIEFFMLTNMIIGSGRLLNIIYNQRSIMAGRTAQISLIPKT